MIRIIIDMLMIGMRDESFTVLILPTKRSCQQLCSNKNVVAFKLHAPWPTLICIPST